MMNGDQKEKTDNASHDPWIPPIIGLCAAILIANLYYAQPLVKDIAADLGLEQGLAGSVVSAIQFGYGAGLFFLVPLADFVENRKLVLCCGLLVLVGLVTLASAQSTIVFLAGAAFTGVFASAAQILLPFLARITASRQRGRIIGAVMAGVLAAVMLARPFALFVSAAFGWRAIFWFSFAAIAILGIVLVLRLPRSKPQATMPYGKALRSMFVLFASEREVQRRTLYQAILFAAFMMFWAAIPIMLAERFGLSLALIGVFALVGAGGVIAAPIAGWLADHGYTWKGTMISSIVLAAAFLGSIWTADAKLIALLALFAVLIDGAIQASQTFSRIVVLNVSDEVRGRVNALYMTIVYFAGAVGSIIGVWTYVRFGWQSTALIGAAMGISVALLLTMEPRGEKRAHR